MIITIQAEIDLTEKDRLPGYRVHNEK